MQPAAEESAINSQQQQQKVCVGGGDWGGNVINWTLSPPLLPLNGWGGGGLNKVLQLKEYRNNTENCMST